MATTTINDAAMTGTTPRAARSERLGRTLRGLGAAGFAFFLIKGLLWLIVPAALWMLRG
jgi:hypothetical protein